VVQTVLTGTIRPNAAEKLAAFGLDGLFDLEIGGYGSDVYPKGSLLLMSNAKAGDKYRARIPLDATVYIADSDRDVEAAKIAGVACLAVASGRSTAADLRAVGADIVLADLGDTAAVIAAVDRLTGVAAAR
jgi:phosphoglycolate phosphatase-like HAD superfamily hydrolase